MDTKKPGTFKDAVRAFRYPPQFVAAVKAAYPDYTRLHELLDENSQMAGRYLDDSSNGTIGAHTVLEYLSRNDIEGLRALASSELEKRELYRQWVELYPKQYEYESLGE